MRMRTLVPHIVQTAERMSVGERLCLSLCLCLRCCSYLSSTYHFLKYCLYGSENWVLNHRLLQALESFQAELGRRILKLPKFSSNYVPMLVLNWPSMCARVLCNKLSFLLRVCNGETTSLGTQVFRNIAASDVTSMTIIKQCYFLDSILETEFTNEVLNFV